MKTTIEIPKAIIDEAITLSEGKSINQLVKEALEEYVKSIKRKKLLTFKGGIDLDMDMDTLRDRK